MSMDSYLPAGQQAKIVAKNIINCIANVLLPRVVSIANEVVITHEELQAASEEHLLNMTFKYLTEVLNGNLSVEEFNYISSMFNDPLTAGEEGLRVLTILNNSIDIQKANYLAQLTIALAKKVITPSQFLDYSELINSVLCYDLLELKKVWSNLNDDGILIVDKNNVSIHRLINFGIGGVVFDQKNAYYKINYNQQSLIQYNAYSQTFINVINGCIYDKIKVSNKVFVTTLNTPPTYSELTYSVVR